MASVADSLKTSSINITNISKSLFETKRSVSTVNDSVNNISKIIATNTRIKKEVFANSQIIESRRREAAKRKEIEDQLESSRVSTSPSRGLAFAGRSDKGPLGRLVGFLGFITAGWIVENLPTWIFMGQEFITRIQIFGRTMYNMVDNMTAIVESFGDILKNSFNAIVTLDFNEFSEGSVAASFDELNLAVQGLGDEITETFRLFTTPLNESVETGEQAPRLDEERTDTMFPEEDTSGGGTVSPQTVYSYLRQKGISHNHAMGILAGIDGESSFQIGIQEKGNTKQGVGLFQYSEASRKAAFLKAVPNYKTNWKGQVDYAINTDPNTAIYLSRQFNNPEAAAEWWLVNWERPLESLRPSRRSKYKQFISSFKPSSGQSQKPTVTPQTPLATSPTSTIGEYFKPLPQGSYKGGSGQGFGASRDGGKRKHLGLDITESNWKPGSDPRIPVVAIRGGIVSPQSYVPGEQYLSGVIIDQDDGYSVRYLHMSPSIKPGQKISAGQRIGRLVNLGNRTHLHVELYSGSKLLDPTKYITSIEKGQTPKAISPAQIASPPSRMAQPAAMTPERKGSQIIFIDDTQPQAQAPQVSYPSQQPTVTPTITEFKLLNNFIKNKLLLDLAYL